MVAKRQVAVLGLGWFGSAVARELTRLGHDVLAVDHDGRTVQGIADDVTHAVQADITDADTLRALGLDHFDTVIIGASSDLAVSILATVLLKQRGVKRIVAKAADELHGSVLERVGADRVVYPEREAAERVAHTLTAWGVLDYLDVAPGYGFARVPAPDSFAGRTVAALDLPRAYGVTLLALCRRGTVLLHPDPGEVLRPDDELVVAGRDEDLERLPDPRLRP